MPRAQPRQAARSRRVEQCCYIEGGRRCRRSASGKTLGVALCNPHTIAVAEQARREAAASPETSGIFELFDRVISGRKVSRKVVEEAVGDVGAWWERYFASRPPSDIPPPNGRGQPRTWYGHQPANPHCPCIACSIAKRARAQADPRAAELAQRRARARAVLGFTPTEPITEDTLKKRHRELVRRHHPDRGGSPTKMAEINDAVDVVRESLVS